MSQEVKKSYPLKITRISSNKLSFLQLPSPKKLSNIVDLRSKMPPIYAQGTLGSCTANALCAIIGYDVPSIVGSRLFLYYNERLLENDVQHDSGATMEDSIKSLQIYGVCQETEWPYIIKNFSVKPPQKCYTSALQHIALQVKHINNDIVSMKNSLDNGYPFVVGIEVYESFETMDVAKTGIVPMPKKKEQLLGGHAVVCVGYDDTKQRCIMRNSWGTSWGIKGYFYLPYAYLTSNMASDLWNIIKVK